MPGRESLLAGAVALEAIAAELRHVAHDTSDLPLQRRAIDCDRHAAVLRDLADGIAVDVSRAVVAQGLDT